MKQSRDRYVLSSSYCVSFLFYFTSPTYNYHSRPLQCGLTSGLVRRQIRILLNLLSLQAAPDESAVKVDNKLILTPFPLDVGERVVASVSFVFFFLYKK